jgi:hypothetical protein
MDRARTWIAAHRKLVVSVAGAVITVAIQAGWTTNPYVSALILIATAAGVYRAPNVPAARPASGPAGSTSRLPSNVTVVPAGLPGIATLGIPAQEPAQAYQQVSGHPLPSAGTEGDPVTGVRP